MRTFNELTKEEKKIVFLNAVKTVSENLALGLIEFESPNNNTANKALTKLLNNAYENKKTLKEISHDIALNLKPYVLAIVKEYLESASYEDSIISSLETAI